MESTAGADLLCDHYHLKNEWQRAGSKEDQIWYSHRFSRQQAELVLREGVGMRQMDIYSAREVYSFPFCPRLYRYSTTHNACLDNDLSCSLRLFLQRVPHRLATNIPLPPSAKKMLRNRLEDLVAAFQYLQVRFGPFQPSLDLIGWTDLKVVKVWIHPDYSCNTVFQPLPSVEKMVRSLVELLFTTGLSKHYNLNDCTTFEDIIAAVTALPQKTPRQVAFELVPPPKREHYSPVQRQSPSEQEIVRRSRKNITFSYSNIGTQHEIYSFKSICASIRNRHRVDPTPTALAVSADLGKSKSTGHVKNLHFQGRRFVSRLSVGSDEQSHSQVSHISLEKSRFKEAQPTKNTEMRADEQQNKQNMNTQPKQQHFNHTSEGFNRQVEEKPTRKGGKGGLKQLLSLQINYLFDESTDPPTAHFDSPPKPLVSPRSQVEDDLDALFHSNKEVAHFDSNDLERELDGILF